MVTNALAANRQQTISNHYVDSIRKKYTDTWVILGENGRLVVGGMATRWFLGYYRVRLLTVKRTGYYIDVIMTAMASQVTTLMVVYSTLYPDADQRKHQSSASLSFVWGIHRDRWIPRTKGQLRGKCFHLMTSSWSGNLVTGFVISDESGNRFFLTAVADYWQDKASCWHEDQRKC